MLLCRVAKEDHDFYQALLLSVSKACHPASILTLFPLDEDTLPAVRVTPAIDAVKAVFKHLDDPEGCKDFFATTFDGLQVSLSASAYHLCICLCKMCMRHSLDAAVRQPAAREMVVLTPACMPLLPGSAKAVFSHFSDPYGRIIVFAPTCAQAWLQVAECIYPETSCSFWQDDLKVQDKVLQNTKKVKGW